MKKEKFIRPNLEDLVDDKAGPLVGGLAGALVGGIAGLVLGGIVGAHAKRRAPQIVHHAAQIVKGIGRLLLIHWSLPP